MLWHSKSFFIRRGLLSRVHSDKALNFVSTAKTLEATTVSSVKLHEYVENRKLMWKIIHPEVPHFGEAEERLIDISKRLFFNIAGLKRLNQDSSATVVCQKESLLNTRPLTAVIIDFKDIECLNPKSFSHRHDHKNGR